MRAMPCRGETLWRRGLVAGIREDSTRDCRPLPAPHAQALEPGKNLVLDAPWEMHVAKEMGTAAAILNKKKGDERESEEDRYRSVRNLADAIVTFEGQWKLRHGSEPPHMQMLVDARATLDLLKRKARKLSPTTAQPRPQQHGPTLDLPERAARRHARRGAQVKFTVNKCLRKHPQLLSSSQFKARHAAKFLQPYPSQACRDRRDCVAQMGRLSGRAVGDIGWAERNTLL